MKSRVLTALVLIPFVVAAFGLAQPWALYLLALVSAAICQREFFGMKSPGRPPVSFVTILVALTTGYVLLSGYEHYSLLALGPLFLIGLAGASILKGRLGYELGSLWFVAPLFALPTLHAFLKPDTLSLGHATLLCVLPLWIGDTAAIFVGKQFGKHLLAPSVSPSKTWEGSIANAIGCIAGSAGFGALMHVGMPQAAAVGAICGVLGQAGDLFESWLKRRAGVKDSGSILPGHGGLLDRIDSLLMSAIPCCYVLMSLR